MESLNTQSLVISQGNEHSSSPLISVQIVEEDASSFDALIFDAGSRAGRMSGIVPLPLSNFRSRPSMSLSDDLREQLKEFARSERGANCLKYFGYQIDIQESCAQQEQALSSFDALFEGLDGGSRVGRMGGTVPRMLSDLRSQPIAPIRDDLRDQLKEFAGTRRGANCLKYFGYYFDGETNDYPISVDLEKALPMIPEANLEPVNAVVESAIRSRQDAAAPATHVEAVVQNSKESGTFKAQGEGRVKASFATQELKLEPKVKETDPKDLRLRQKVRKAIEASNPKPEKIRKEKHRRTFTTEEKFQRNAIIWAASACLLVSCAAQIMHSLQNQSLQQIAVQKLNARDFAAAKSGFEKIIRAQPQNWEAYLGHAAAIPGEYAKQIDDYNQVLTLKNGEPRAVLGLAKSYYELGDYAKAIAFANRSYAQTSNVESLEIKANSLMKLKNFAAASKIYQQVLAQSPKPKADLFYKLASCQKELGNRNQQIEYLRKASAVEPRNTSYLNQLAMLFVAENKFEDAKIALQKAVSINARESELHVRLAKVLAQLNAPNKAVNELSQAIEHGRGPKADLLKQRASLLCSMNNYGRALADVDSAMVLKPSDKTLPKMRERIVNQLAIIKAGLDRQLGRQLANNNHEPSSVKIASAPPATNVSGTTPAISSSVVDGAHSQQMVLKAYKHIKSGDFKSAIPVLQTAVKSDPENSQAHRYLAFSYLNSGMVAKALTHSKQVLALGTEHPHDLYSLGEAHFYDGKPQEAMKYYRDALRINPLHVEARMGAIRSLIAMGKVEEAKSVCEAAAYNSRSEKAKFQFRRMLNDIKSKNQIAAARSFKS